MQRNSWAWGLAIVVAAAFGASGCSTESAHPGIDGGPILLDARASSSPGDALDGVAETSSSPADALDATDASADTGAHVDCPGPSDPLLPPNTTHVGTAYTVGVTPRNSQPPFISDTATAQWTATDGPGQTGTATFSDPNAFVTDFTCTQVGAVLITVHVLLPGTSCDSTFSLTVQCQT